MNCFNHPDRPALGICKSCGKGLCRDCLTEVPNGLACAQVCEARVNLINRIIDNNQKIISAANGQVRSSGQFVLLMGVLFCLFGFVPYLISGSSGTLFMGVLGLLFLGYGVLRLLRKSQYYPTEK